MFLLSLFHFPGAVKCSLPFCMALHVTVSLVLSLVLLSCPLFSIGLCALLKVKANPEFSQTCSFLGLTECKTSGGGGGITCLYYTNCQHAVVGLFQSGRDNVVQK